MLYLPYWLVVYETLAANDTDRRARSERRNSVDDFMGQSESRSSERLAVLVCRLCGQAARIGAEQLTGSARAEPLPPILEPAEAEEHAADFAARLLLAAARGRRRRERGAVVRAEPWAYPYWVQYLKRSSRIDFRALDAVSARPAGTAVRGAIAQGIVRSLAAGA